MGSRSCRACSNSLRALPASTFPQGWPDPGSSQTNRRHARKMSQYSRVASTVVVNRISTRPVGMNFAMENATVLVLALQDLQREAPLRFRLTCRVSIGALSDVDDP